MEANGEKCVSVLKGSLHGWITWGVFWGVCTCSNSIYTTIPMPLSSYLVSPVSLSFEFIHLFFWWEFSLRRKQEPEVLCFSLIEIVCDVDEFYYCCLQFFWTHPETMQCFVVDTKSTFFRSLISAPKYTEMVMVLKKTTGVIFLPMFWKLLLPFYFSCPLCLMYTSLTAAYMLVFSHLVLSYTN